MSVKKSETLCKNSQKRGKKGPKKGCTRRVGKNFYRQIEFIDDGLRIVKTLYPLGE
jgi:hypothetical protein